MMSKLITQFAKLFSGYEKAHGQYDITGAVPDESGKIKGRAKTQPHGPTAKEYERHLNGEGPFLGIIPLRADNTCWFGAIDIDIVGAIKLSEKIEELEKRIRTMELPLVVCRSKSGGAHLYLFASSPIPARILQEKLTQFAANLGYGGTEVFPKQIMRVNDNDRGNWINIDFYGVLSKDGTKTYCVRNGKHISKLEDFCNYAEQMRVSSEELQAVQFKMSDDFNDGPPCLQHIATFGLGEGSRNTALTNIGIYFKMSNEDNWQDKTYNFNMEHFNPPLPANEVQQVVKNVSRKDYFYTCKQPPLVTHCDKKACLKRKFGVGSGAAAGELFPIDNITKCSSKDSVRWYAEHQGMRIELTTEQLLSPQLLQRVFLEKFSVLIIPGKGKDWHAKLKEIMETADEVHDPEDASRQGQFENLLDSFFTNSRPARNKDELIKGNSYVEDERIYFRSEDLLNYLNIKRFTHQPHEIWMWLKQQNAEAKQMKVKGKMLRVWSLPQPEVFDGSTIDLPNMQEEL
jgi:hypothetical protein